MKSYTVAELQDILSSHKLWLEGKGGERADLSYSNLSGSNLSEAKNFHYSILPDGEITGWKKLQGGIVCELLIPRESVKVCTPIGRKCRTNRALVVSLSSGTVGFSQYDSGFTYEVGQWVETTLDKDFRVECSTGIHFFITKEEAENY